MPICIVQPTRPKSAGNWHDVSLMFARMLAFLRTVFFFARSPEAPKTTMMVLSLSSMFLSRDLVSCGAQNAKGIDRVRASTNPSAEEREALEQKTTAG